MNKKEVGKKLSMDGGKHIGSDMEYNVAHAIRIVGTRDRDGDGVIDMYDCQPLNPDKDGFWGDVGHAARRRVASELDEIKQRTIKGVEGEDAMEKRKTLRRIQQEEEFVEEIKQAKARGKQKARAKYGVAPTTKPKKKKRDKDILSMGRLKTRRHKKKKYPSCV